MFLSLLDEVLPAMLRQCVFFFYFGSKGGSLTSGPCSHRPAPNSNNRIAVDTTQEMVRSYFLRKGQTYEHPLIRLAKDMIYEVLVGEQDVILLATMTMLILCNSSR